MTTTLQAPAPQTTKQEHATPATPARMLSLDIFRGATIAAMILVNNPGDWSHIYWPLGHAEWNGWTPTDLIFPFFVFIVGVAMVLSFSARRRRGATRGELLRHSLQRAAIIFALGLFLSGFPKFDFATIRIPGVLQRIAVAYLVTAVLVLYTGRRAWIAASVAALVGYWAALRFIPVPGIGAGIWTMDGCLNAWLDRKLLWNHLWIPHRWDPEGILSTVPAVATCLLGVFTGEWLRSGRSPHRKIGGMLAAGTAGLLLGMLWNNWFPVNKNLWTSSYVLLACGLALVCLAACYWLADVRGWRAWGRPFDIFGMNAITVFFLSGLVGRLTMILRVDLDGQRVALKTYLYQVLFSWIPDLYIRSIAWALLYIAVFFALSWVMYRRKIFIKV